MSEDELKKLIEEFIEGSISEENRIRLEEWYASFEKEEGFTKTLTEDEHLLLERKIWDRVRGKVKPLAETPVISLPWYRNLRTIAAVLTGCLLLSAAILLFLNARSGTTVKTAYGEIKRVVLPDESVVMLNGNSSIRYVKNWNKSQTREVWLEGEAFFKVTHQRNDQKFTVHTSDDFNVQVLGTMFNIDNRDNAVEVVLNEGSIRLRYANNDTLTLKPGSYARYEKSTAILRMRAVQSERYSSWINGREYFDNTPIRQVMALLENTYGYSVEVRDTAILSKKVTGSMPTDSMDGFMKALSGAVGITVSLKGRHIVLENKKLNSQ